MKENQTHHKIFEGAAQNMHQIADNSIALTVTSPPYPMIEMWDEIFALQNPNISTALQNSNGMLAFELMHEELDKVWKEIERVLIPGGFACINIGDATRTMKKEFALYPNHGRIISSFQNLGMSNLPNIIWRKQTNAPNKFMGSGMLPAGAYVTLEHEWILVFRKEGKRKFQKEKEKIQRRESSFFWEERNIWFSDLWDLKGTRQVVKKSETRKRSAAYPFEIPYRLINMYSLKDDYVLDPFLGTGTTTLAAIASQRNSYGIDIDPVFIEMAGENILSTDVSFFNARISNRLLNHREFVKERMNIKGENAFKYFNDQIQEKVMTRQELALDFNLVENVQKVKGTFMTNYCHEK